MIIALALFFIVVTLIGTIMYLILVLITKPRTDFTVKKEQKDKRTWWEIIV